jgi:hypothetical protein
VTLTNGIWPAWVAGATIVSDDQTHTIATRNSDTQVTVTVAPNPAWSGDMHTTTLTKIVGIDLNWEGANNYVEGCMVRMSDAADPFPSDTGKTGSVGIYVQQHGARIEGVRLQGSDQSNEVGVRVGPSRNRVYIDVDTITQQFDQAGDSVVTFDDPLSTGLVYITYSSGETPLTIPANWGAGGSMKIWKRLGETGAWIEVTQGVAQP